MGNYVPRFSKHLREISNLSSLIQAQEVIQKLSSEDVVGETESQNLLMFSSEAFAEVALALPSEDRAKTAVAQSGSGLRIIDPRMVELLEKQKKRAKVSDASGIRDLMVGDIHHRPVVVTSFLGVMLVAGLAIAFPISISSYARSHRNWLCRAFY